MTKVDMVIDKKIKGTSFTRRQILGTLGENHGRENASEKTMARGYAPRGISVVVEVSVLTVLCHRF